MSLIAWYPLNGDLKDYSLNENHLSYNFNSGNLTADIGGKIGKCYQRAVANTGTDYLRSKSKINLSGDFTMTCWAYVSAFSSATEASGLITNHDHTKNLGSGITLRWISDTDYRMSINTGDGSNRTFNTYYGSTNIKNKWCHLLVRFIKATNTLSIWVNGQKENELTYAMATGADYLDLFGWSTGFEDSPSYRPACKLNDVRVYDNALSDKEIKELAKAKILHYSFNDLQEPTENLWAGAINVYNNFGVPATFTDTGETYLGQPVYRLGMTVDSAHAGNLGSFQTALHSHGVFGSSMLYKANTKYAASIYWRMVNKSDIVFGGTASNIGNWYEGVYDNTPGKWNRYTQYRNGTATADQTDNVFFSFYSPSLAVGETVYIDVCCPQIEMGKDYCTDYVKGRRDGVVRDNSGFMNDVVLSGDVGIKFSSSSGVFVSGNTIQKTSKTLMWDAGAFSDQKFYNNCFLEWSLDYQGRTGAEVGAEMIGFAASSTSWGFGDINYAMYIHSNGDIKIYESGTDKGTKATWDLKVSNVFRIEIKNNTVYYYLNGTLIYTSLTTPTFPLSIDTCLHCYGYTNKVINIKVGYLPYSTTNPKWITDSKLGKGAYYFDGVDDHFSIPSLADFRYSNGFTYCLWAYATEAKAWARFFDAGISQQNDNIVFTRNAGTNELFLEVKNGTASGATLHAAGLELNKWQHIAMSIDPAGNAKLYINGVVIASGVVQIPNNVSRPNTFIGRSNWATDDYYKGSYDDVRLYASVLSDADIEAIYKTKGSIDNAGNLYVSNAVESNTWDDEIKSNNLVTNGDCSKKSDYNFTGAAYDSKENCLTNYYTCGTVYSNEFIPVDRTSVYKLSGEFKAMPGAAAAPYYFGVQCFDAQQRFIEHWMVNYYANTKTTLAAALKPGDTTITLTSGANWIATNPGSLDYNKFIGFWGAESEYPAYTYTRRSEQYLSINGNVITLPAPWANSEVAAGTPVANMASGGTYSYIAAAYIKTTSDWVKKQATISGRASAGGDEVSGTFRYGTEYIRVIILTNYDINSNTGFRHIKFWNDTFSQNINSPSGAKSVTEKSQLLTSRISEVGITDGLVGWWPFVKNTRDISGNKSDGTAIAATQSAGPKGGSYLIGSSKRIDTAINMPTFIANNAGYTLSINLKLPGTICSGNEGAIFGSDGYNWGILATLVGTTDWRITASQWGDDGVTKTGYYVATSVAANTWIHVTVTYDVSTKMLKLYINGVLKNQVKVIKPLYYYKAPLIFGSSGATWWVDAFICDARLYNRALSPEEVGILYEVTNGVKAAKMTNNTMYLGGQLKEV